MTENTLNFTDLIEYLEEYIEFYRLNHSEKLLLKNYCEFVYQRHKKLLMLGEELEE